MNMNDVYTLTNGQYLHQIAAVDNPFIRQLSFLATEQAKQLKMVSVVLKDKANNRGEIAQRGIHASQKSIIDLCKLTPLADPQNRTLLQEIANYRASTLNFSDMTPTFAKDNAEMLLVDYLLSSALCYIEVFDKSSNVEKFFATRNRFIAGGIAELQPTETAKYVSYLQTYSANYQTKQLKVLKINVNKKGFSITQPRKFIDFNKTIKITPLFLMNAFVEGVTSILQHRIVKFTYIKDNLTEREFISTLSPQILHQYYEDTFVQKMLSSVGSQLHRGYIRLPELGISKYDHSGVRALNVSRVTSVELLDSFDASYIDVDFDIILPSFKESVYNQRDPIVLNHIYEDLTGKPAPQVSVPELRNDIIAFVDGQYAMGTTTALRYIHKYMEQRKKFFPLYNGGKPVQYGSIDSTFDLGLAEG